MNRCMSCQLLLHHRHDLYLLENLASTRWVSQRIGTSILARLVHLSIVHRKTTPLAVTHLTRYRCFPLRKMNPQTLERKGLSDFERSDKTINSLSDLPAMSVNGNAN